MKVSIWEPVEFCGTMFFLGDHGNAQMTYQAISWIYVELATIAEPY